MLNRTIKLFAIGLAVGYLLAETARAILPQDPYSMVNLLILLSSGMLGGMFSMWLTREKRKDTW